MRLLFTFIALLVLIGCSEENIEKPKFSTEAVTVQSIAMGKNILPIDPITLSLSIEDNDKICLSGIDQDTFILERIAQVQYSYFIIANSFEEFWPIKVTTELNGEFVINLSDTSTPIIEKETMLNNKSVQIRADKNENKVRIVIRSENKETELIYNFSLDVDEDFKIE